MQRNRIAFLFVTIFTLGLACNLPLSIAPTPAERALGQPTQTEVRTIAVATQAPIANSSLPEPTGPLTTVTACSHSGKSVVIIVEPLLAANIRSGLDQFEADLCADGYTIIERISDFQNPPAIRAYLANLYLENQEHLSGAILMGDLPYAHQTFMTSSGPNAPLEPEEVISFQYYSDLDGIFDITDDYSSLGGFEYSYNIHEGEVDWEIWVGVMPVYKDEFNATVQAVERYFIKNHAYRMGEYTMPRAFIEINEHHTATTMAEHDQVVGWLTDGDYSWTPFSNAPNVHFYFDSAVTGLTAAQGYRDMSAGVADFAVLSAHGWWGAHGQIDILWVENNPVSTAFFWSDGCAVGNLDYADNFLTAALYSPNSLALVARGTTNNSGGMGTNQNGFFGHNIATAMSQGQSFGDAILDHVNVPLAWPWSEERELHFATSVILGDPTLKLRIEAPLAQTPSQPISVPTPTNSVPAPPSDYVEQPPYSGDCAQRPENSICLMFQDNYIWLVYDSIIGRRDGGVWEGNSVEIIEGAQADYYHVLWTLFVKEVSK
ncbi:MAG: hypothetical protein HN413_15430 [Chloroflexi bacterium]|nr:hypothetical protein [Chloroflexota bacterium]